jgi:hypothetical protein
MQNTKTGMCMTRPYVQEVVNIAWQSTTLAETPLNQNLFKDTKKFSDYESFAIQGAGGDLSSAKSSLTLMIW